MKKGSGTLLQQNRAKKQIRVYSLCILAFTFVLYGNGIRNGYAFDDNYVTVTTPQHPNNPRVEKGISGIPDIITSYYIQSQYQSFDYRPLVLITYALEYEFFGSDPHISHFINVLLYALSGILLFQLLARLLKDKTLILPALATFLFIAHPIHTEVVNNLKSRDELLSFLLGILTLRFCLNAVERGRWLPLVWAALTLFLALLVKKTAVFFIFLIPLVLYFFSDVKIKRIGLLGLAMFVIYIAYHLFGRAIVSQPGGLREYAFFENPLFFEHDLLKRIPFVFQTMGYYLKLMLWPYPLVCYYGYNAIPMLGWDSPLVWISLLVHLGIGIFCLVKLPKKNILAFSGLVYLAGIIPFSNLYTPVVGIVGERFVYFSSLGYCLAFAYVLMIISKKVAPKGKEGWQSIAPATKIFLVMIFCAFSFSVIARNAKWKDMLTLCRNDVKLMDDSYMLQFFTAKTLYDKSQVTPLGMERDKMLSEAAGHFRKAANLLEEGLKQYPEDYHTMSALGTLYVNYLGDINAAMPWFKRSLAIKHDYEVGRYNLAFCYERMNRPDTALVLYEKMVAAGASYAPIYYRLHELYVQKEQYQKAIELNKKSLVLNPQDIKLYVNLGNAYMLQKDTLNGLKFYEAAAAASPRDRALLMHVANIYSLVGNEQKAREYEKKAVLLKKARPSY